MAKEILAAWIALLLLLFSVNDAKAGSHELIGERVAVTSVLTLTIEPRFDASIGGGEPTFFTNIAAYRIKEVPQGFLIEPI